MPSLPTLRRYIPGDGDSTPYESLTGPPGVLCLHGFTGTPFEVRPLAEGLAARGFSALAPRLAGHATTPADLAPTRWPDWLASADAALTRLRHATGGARVVVAGFSMGGLLALMLAHRRPGDVAAIAVMAAPLRLRGRDARLVRWLATLPRPLRRGPVAFVPKRRGPDTSDPQMYRKNPGLPVLPVAALASLFELGKEVRDVLPHITTPTLVVAARQDHTVPFEDSLELAGCLGHAPVERLWLERSYHLIGIDVEREAVTAALAAFFERHLPTRPTAAPAHAAAPGVP